MFLHSPEGVYKIQIILAFISSLININKHIKNTFLIFFLSNLKKMLYFLCVIHINTNTN